MKKLIALAVAALVAGAAFADDLGGAAINVNGTWYAANGWGGGQFDWCTGGDFGAESLGEIYSLTLGGQVQYWGSLTGDGISGKLYYKFDSDDSTIGSADLSWGWTADNGNQVWQTGGAELAGKSIDISGLSEGKHDLNVWFVGSNGSGDQYDSNGGNNYIASFTKVAAPVPEPATMSLLGLGALAMVLRRKLRK